MSTTSRAQPASTSVDPGRMSTLLRITAALSKAATVREVTAAVIAEAMPALGAAHAAIGIRTGDEVELIDHSGLSEARRQVAARFSVSWEVPAGVVVRTGAAIFIASRAEGERLYPALYVADDLAPRLAALPLLAADTTLGVLSFGFAHEAPFLDDERDFLQAVAGLCATALHRARLYDSERRERARADRIAAQAIRIEELTRQLSRPVSTERVAELVIDQGVQTIGAATGALWLVEPGAARARMLRSVGYPDDGSALFQVLDLERASPLGEAIRTGRPVFVESVEAYEQRYPESERRTRAVTQPGDMTIACLPLVTDDTPFGGLAFVFRDVDALDDDGRRFLTQIASHAATAIERSRRLQSERSARAEAESARQRMAILDAITRELVDDLPIGPRRAEQIAHLMVPAIADWCTLWVIVDGRIEPVATAHLDPERARRAREYLRQHPLNPELPWGIPAVLRSGRTELIRQVSVPMLEAASANAEQLALLQASGMHAHLAVPLNAHGNIVGCISLAQTSSTRDFTDDDVALAEEVAVRVALAVQLGRQLAATEAARGEAEVARRRADTLAVAGKVLAGTLDYATTLERVANLALPEYADWCLVDLLVDDSGTIDRVAVGHADAADAPLAERLERRYAPPRQRQREAIAAVLNDRRPTLLAHISDELLERIARDPEHLELLRAMRMTSAVIAPLVARGRTLGTLSFCSKTRSYTPDMLSIATELADRAALSIDNALLYRAAQEAQQRTARLQAITAALSNATSAAEAARIVVREALPIIDATAGCVLLVDEAARRFRLVGAAGDADERLLAEVDGVPLAARLPMCEAVETGQVVWLSSIDAIVERNPELRHMQESQGVAAWGAVPLNFEGRTIGVVNFHCLRERALSPDERGFLLAIGHDCAQALTRMRLDEATRAARADAEAASRAKDEFLAMLGHELRNPLAPIQTAVQLMKMRDASTHERERVIIERQLSHVVRLVDDLLDVARIERGHVELSRETVELGDVVHKAVEMTRTLFEQRQHQLSVDVPGGLILFADPVRLAQVVSNLLSNAARYTPPPGRISVAAAREGDEVVVRVRDNGVGIPAELLPRMFELFVQGRQAIDRSSGGLGLGLAVVRTMVTLHGGSVSAHSDGPGRGSELVVRLPLARAVAPSGGVEPPTLSSTAKRILIVDDNHDAAEMLADLLSSLGHSVEIAHDGPSGLERAERFRPDLALLDIGLPVMDGYELAARIRALDGMGALELVAITGYGQASDRDKAMRAGFAAHLVKPVAVEDIEKIIARVQ